MRRASLRALSILCLLSGSLLLSAQQAPRQTLKPVIRGAVFSWEPYEYLGLNGSGSSVKGFDVELTRELFEPLDYGVKLVQMEDVRTHRPAIENGSIDFTTSPRVPELERYALFSDPIRRETEVLFVRLGEENSFRFQSVGELIDLLRRRKLRLGVMRGLSYTPAALREFIAAGTKTGMVAEVETPGELVHALADARSIDAFILDRLAGETAAQQKSNHQRLEPVALPAECSLDICLMFSRKTVPPALVARFNENLAEMKRTLRYGQLVRFHALPILLSMTVQKPWFLAMDLIGVLAFAIAGTLIARKENYSVFGALFIAALPTVGGGLVRDIIVGRRPVAILRSPLYLTTIITVVLVGFVISKISDRFHRGRAGSQVWEPSVVFGRLDYPLEVCDALGLAVCVIIGVIVAVETRAVPLLLWGPILAALSGCGGGILRDVVRARAGNPILTTSFYGEVAFIWGLLFSIFLRWETWRLDPVEVSIAVVVTFIGAFLTRMVVVHRRAKSPSFGRAPATEKLP